MKILFILNPKSGKTFLDQDRLETMAKAIRDYA